MQLPKSLAPWADILSQFPKEIALVIGGLALKVNRFIGSIEQFEQQGTEIPDGFEGITRKGPVERLLISEWLYAEEFPDEFHRRVSMQEQLYTRLKQQKKRSVFKTLVLLDAGPFQLGSPRIVQLALLVVLARRAELANCTFSWGIFQHPQNGFFQILDPHNVMSFLKARSSQPVTKDLVDQWSVLLRQEDTIDDMWIIGPKDVAREFPEYSQVIVEESWNSVHNEVQIEVRQSARPKKLVLQMPRDRLCARLLRDPYQEHQIPDVHQATSIADNSEFIFSRNGRRFAYRTMNGRFISYPIPNSPNAKLGKPRIFTPSEGHRLLGITHRRKGFSALTINDDSNMLFFHRVVGHEGHIKRREITQSIIVDEDVSKINEIYIIQNDQMKLDLYLLDSKRQLRLLSDIPDRVIFSTVAISVIGVGGVHNGFYYAIYNIQTNEIEVTYVKNHHPATTFRYPVKNPITTYLDAYGRLNWNKNEIGILIAKTSPHSWLMIYKNHVTYLETESDEKVIGAILMGVTDGLQPALVILKHSREIFARTVQSHFPPFVVSTSEIINAKVNPYRDEIVYVNSNRDLKVYSIEKSADVMHIVAREDL